MSTQAIGWNVNLCEDARTLLEEYYAQDFDLIKILKLCADWLESPIGLDQSKLDINFTLLVIKNSLDSATIQTDLEHGFLWLENGDGENVLQLCCNEKGQVDPLDHGGDWGICWDVNSEVYGNVELRNLAIEYALNHVLPKSCLVG